ncbi:two-component sensor histidine kinase [Sinomonas cyclohexanicum]|uniref:Sensor histidine kinase MtrB n=1 Tax=Sinomonas cyclohexanicum TaxID=322009 RepID=A0ABM7PWX2_SINCY|nr:MtrAB system histidine kinase MtrB [Corynebacterium cyclohexanicum]BCT76796.1 two-component sensor histidine kinase [Corynebacterium cyclohexanicum]
MDTEQDHRTPARAASGGPDGAGSTSEPTRAGRGEAAGSSAREGGVVVRVRDWARRAGLRDRARITVKRARVLAYRAIRAIWRGLRSIGPGIASARGGFARRWRRSLQFRTVLITLVLTFVSFMAVGAYLSNQIANNLFQERLTQAEVQTRQSVQQVQETFDGAQVTDQQGVLKLVNDTLNQLEARESGTPRQYVFLAVPNQDQPRNRWVDSRASYLRTENDIPQALRDAVQHSQQEQYWQSIPLTVDNRIHPAIAVGNKVSFGGTVYELYLIYDIDSAQQTLDDMQNVLWFGGLFLLLLIGAITWIVTRSVVSPVSHAAAVSEKLAAGQLEERMAVEGEDEVARLGAAFNHMAANLQEQITALANLSHMQQRFVSDVSHELRTPLTTVRMAAEVLYDAREEFNPVTKRSAELLYNQVERFQALLNDLLEISRFDAGAAVLDAEPTDLIPVVRSVIETAAPIAAASGSEVRFFTRVASIVVDMDDRRIERVLRNLLLNALEHGEGRPVEIFVAANADAVGVSVRDHGIGMSPPEAARVFDRFWRADPARARTTGGSGLGLSIATEDVKLHGGWLQAWGARGEGSCFRMTLPLRSGGAILESPVALEPAGGDVVLVEEQATRPFMLGAFHPAALRGPELPETHDGAGSPAADGEPAAPAKGEEP